MKKLLLLLIICLSFCGCSYKELNELAIANSIGIDYEDGKYKITAQVMKLSKSSEESSSNSTILYEGSGDSIVSAIKNVSLKYPNYLYLGHLELLVVGKSIVNDDIEKVFDYFLRSPEARNDIYFLISSEHDAKEILDPKEEEKEEFPTKDIITTIKNSTKHNGYTINVTLEEFVKNYYEKGIDSLVPNINLSKDEENKNTYLDNVAVFKQNKYLVNLNDKEILAYNIINNNIEDIVINTHYKNYPVTVSATFDKSKLSVKADKNKVDINISINVTGKILEADGKIDFTEKNVMNIISKNVEDELVKYTNDLIEYCLKNDVDILGIENKIYKFNNKFYSIYKHKNLYEIANFNFNNNVKVYNYDSIYKSASGGIYE